MKINRTLLFLMVVAVVAVACRAADIFDIRILTPQISHGEYVDRYGPALFSSTYPDGTIDGYWAEDDGCLRRVVFRNGQLDSETVHTKEELWRRQSTVKRFNMRKSKVDEVGIHDPAIERLQKRQ